MGAGGARAARLVAGFGLGWSRGDWDCECGWDRGWDWLAGGVAWVPLAGRGNWGSAGLAEWRRGAVEELEVGEAACEAMDSTSSMEWACQPWLTLIIAYERRVLRSEVSCARGPG